MPRYRVLKVHLPFLSRWRQSPSDLSKIELRGHKWTWATQLCCHLLSTGAILTALGFGGSSRVFTLKTQMVLGNSVDPDLQLAFLGLINKFMDLLLTKALQITAGVIVTLWMTRSRRSSGARGARIADFELSEELTKPWAALSQFTKRWSNNGWKGAGKTRFLITLSISVCVLLQGLAVNTVGVPKQRWWPESSDALNVSHPLCNLRSLDWMNFWDSSWGTVGGGDISWDVMGSYIATSSHLAFRDFATTMDSNPRGWQDFRRENSGAFVALDTRHNGSSTRGFALHTSQAVDAFSWMQTNGTADARRASGISGELKLTVPGTLVSCRTSDLRPFLDANALSVTVDKPLHTLAGATNFQSICSPRIRTVTILKAPLARCNATAWCFRQASGLLTARLLLMHP